jgi:hypothetical protein
VIGEIPTVWGAYTVLLLEHTIELIPIKKWIDGVINKII